MQDKAREGSLALDSISHVQELVGPLHFLFRIRGMLTITLSLLFSFKRKEMAAAKWNDFFISEMRRQEHQL